MKQLDKETKVSIQFMCAALVLICGITLMFLGFFTVPVGEISSSVLTGLGECLTFTGSVWGIERTYNYKTNKLEKTIEEERNMHHYNKRHHEEEFDA